MKIVFTHHAEFRMRERGVKKAEVSAAVLSPDAIVNKGNQKVAKKIRKNGQLLIVYYMEDTNIVRVITVITTSKLSKYLK